MLLDFHSHSGKRTPGEQVIQNLIIPLIGQDPGFDRDGSPDRWFSAGVHPWYIDEDKVGEQLTLLRELAGASNVKAVGECGLDRLRGPSLDLQQRVFEEQLDLAGMLRKPVIVHCVRCFAELVQTKRRLSVAVPLVVHGYNNKLAVARELLDQGFYFSFGSALLSEWSNAAKVIAEVPADRFFLETDDRDVSILAVYEQAARIKKIPVNQLEEIIFATYLGLGGKKSTND